MRQAILKAVEEEEKADEIETCEKEVKEKIIIQMRKDRLLMLIVLALSCQCGSPIVLARGGSRRLKCAIDGHLFSIEPFCTLGSSAARQLLELATIRLHNLFRERRF